jgi:cytochrome c553
MRSNTYIPRPRPSRNYSDMQARKLLVALIVAVPALAAAATPAARDLTQASRATPDLERGGHLFTQCISCHGSNGAGVQNGETPRIAGQHPAVLLKQLVDFRHGKRWDFRMEERAKDHHLKTPQDIADVAAYIAQLDGGAQRGVGDGTETTEGARLFGSRCAACHGASGGGNVRDAVPRLAGQHYGYLMRQMYDAVDGRRPAMPRVHPRAIAPLNFEQVRAVSDYLSRTVWGTDPAAQAPR